MMRLSKTYKFRILLPEFSRDSLEMVRKVSRVER